MNYKLEIQIIAECLAMKYKDNPLQAAFIFDRIFRKSAQNPEIQFKIAADDCGTEINTSIRAVHTAAKSNLQLQECALKNFSLAFKKQNVDFLAYYTPNQTNLISFDSEPGRVNAQGAQFSNLSIKVRPRNVTTFFAGNSSYTSETADVVVARGVMETLPSDMQKAIIESAAKKNNLDPTLEYLKKQLNNPALPEALKKQLAESIKQKEEQTSNTLGYY